jgi:hypothetical protein
MSTLSESSKLVELRAKTDRQLVAIITNRLEKGLNLAQTDLSRARAREAYAEARKLLPWVSNLNRSERRHLEEKLERLRQHLNAGASAATACAACS